MPPRRPRLVRRVQLARRLAAGLDPARAAQAARCPAELLEQLMGEAAFLEIVQGWRELLALAPEARTERLTKLAQLVLEEALERRSLPAALFTLAQARRGRDPVRTLVDGLERGLARAAAEHAAEHAAEGVAAAPAAAAPASRDPQGSPPAPPDPRPRPDPLATLCHRTAAGLQAAIVVEQGRWTAAAAGPDPQADPLGAAVHALHRAAAAGRCPPPPPARTPEPIREKQRDALTARLMHAFAQAGPAERLALERLDDAALERLARRLLLTPTHPGPAQPQGP